MQYGAADARKDSLPKQEFEVASSEKLKTKQQNLEREWLLSADNAVLLS